MTYTQFNDWVKEHYTHNQLKEVDGELKAAGEKWLNQFSQLRKGINLAEAHKVYDRAALEEGGSQARDAVCKIILTDTIDRRLDYGVVGEVLHRSRQHTGGMNERIYLALEPHINGHNTGLLRTFEHADRFCSDVLIPMYKIQHPAWRDRLNNGTVGVLNGLYHALAIARKAEHHHAPAEHPKSRQHKVL